MLYQRMPVARATFWSILGASLILPARTIVDLPLIPPLDKVTVSNVAAFVVCRFILGKPIKLFPKLGLGTLLFLVYISSPFMTAFLNPEPIIAGPRIIKGMEYYDAFSSVLRQLLFILPFLLGFSIIRDHKNFEELLKVLIVAGLFYSLPMLFEIRMSPQLHTWIYGFFPHSFEQQMREGGFRPVVFMGHGLLVAFFAMSAMTAAGCFWKMNKPVLGFQPMIITLYLLFVLVLCKSMASLMYGFFLLVLIHLFSAKTHILIARLMVIFVLVYPMLRSLEWVPVTDLIETAEQISEQRAASLQTRFENEDLILHHVRDKAWFGWGSWGRNRVYDPLSGNDLTTTDGRWVIVMGESGWIGFLAEFGLLILPVLRSVKALPYLKNKREQLVFSTLVLHLAVSIFDLLPNATVSPWVWLLAGALFGRIEQLRLSGKQISRNGRRKPVTTRLKKQSAV